MTEVEDRYGYDAPDVQLCGLGLGFDRWGIFDGGFHVVEADS